MLKEKVIFLNKFKKFPPKTFIMVNVVLVLLNFKYLILRNVNICLCTQDKLGLFF